MENILVSACLLGVCCRYDGSAKPNENVIKLKEKYNLIPVCPEVLGGLKIPHPPSEIQNEKVISKNGEDVTKYFICGAEKVLETAFKNNCKKAVLKSKSPSCGTDFVYDGTFCGKLIKGTGVTAKLLLKNNIKLTDENNLSNL